MPAPNSERAGPGALVRIDGTVIQFDAGRATSMRLAALGVELTELSAVCLTHHHSDHLLGLDDLALARWFATLQQETNPLPVVAPRGPCVSYVERMLSLWHDDIAVRQHHSGTTSAPGVDLHVFDPSPEPSEVWRNGTLSLSAVTVHHEPVVPSVAYRVDSRYGAVVISGDTVACREVEELARGSAVLVHSAASPTAIGDGPLRRFTDYHADAREVGAIAARVGVPTLILTHLLPQPDRTEVREAFVEDVRRGGYEGELVVADDLDRVDLSR